MGVVCLLIFGAALLQRHFASRQALREFDQAQRQVEQAGGAVDLPDAKSVDVSLWSPKRVREYRESLSIHKNMPLAVLSIEKFHLRVPVFQGTDDLTLNRGAGWIEGTALPGGNGNVGISAHRDGFFRVLKDISTGDTIELATPRGTAEYVVDQLEIVDPQDVGVLRPRSVPSLTLVTCYPFYFVGSAPQRFIVHAALQHGATTGEFQEGSAIVRTKEVNKEKER